MERLLKIFNIQPEKNITQNDQQNNSSCDQNITINNLILIIFGMIEEILLI
ncbi:hypothetical protein D3C78_609310 [compost metagenome]